MSYHVEYSDTALKQLRKMDRFEARLIVSWIDKNLQGCADPRVHGKGLTANRSGEWRYRIGSYRALCIIEDDRLIIEVFSVGHRKHIYGEKRSRTPATANGPGAHATNPDLVDCHEAWAAFKGALSRSHGTPKHARAHRARCSWRPRGSGRDPGRCRRTR